MRSGAKAASATRKWNKKTCGQPLERALCIQEEQDALPDI